MLFLKCKYCVCENKEEIWLKIEWYWFATSTLLVKQTEGIAVCYVLLKRVCRINSSAREQDIEIDKVRNVLTEAGLY